MKKGVIFFVILFCFCQNVFSDENFIFQNNSQSPYFKIDFQRPSYILENEEYKSTIYHCDNKRSECKVNMNLVQESGKKLSSTIECSIQTSFTSEQFSRCNPNTVIFPEGIHTLKIQASLKKNLENYSFRKIIIVNGDFTSDEIISVKNDFFNLDEQKKVGAVDLLPLQEEKEEAINTSTKKIYSGEVLLREIISGEAKPESKETVELQENNTTSTNTPSSEEESNNVPIDIPDFTYIFQRPSYILDTEEKNIYNCDASKGNKCKVNLKLTTIDGKDISSKFECKIGLNFISSEYQKCNPNTIVFPKGKNKIIFTVFEKGNKNNFKEKIIWINYTQDTIDNIDGVLEQKDNNITTETSLSSVINSDKEEASKTLISIPDFQYIFQRPSYILETDTDNRYICDHSKGDECKVNFKLEIDTGKDISSKFECEINIDNSLVISSCNPNTIIFPIGDNTIVFRVFEKGNENNFKEKIIYIHNSEISEQDSSNTSSEALSSSSSSLSQEQERHYLPHTKIQVQGRIGKTKKVGLSSMTCYTYSQCSINFTSGKIYASQREGVYFSWDFGNGEKYNDYNPKSIKFSPGFYKVKLTVSDSFGNKKVEIYRVNVIHLYTKTEIKNIQSSLTSVQQFSIEYELLENLKQYSPNQLTSLSDYKKSLESLGTGESFLTDFGWLQRKTLLSQTNTDKKGKSIQSEKLKILAKNISLRVSFQKKNLKVYGTSEPNSEISIKIGEQEFKQKTDSMGNYIYKINTLTSGLYTIQATVINNEGQIVAQKFSAEKEFTEEYISQLESYKTNTLLSTTGNSKSLAKNITLRVALQKKNLKVSGKSFPHSKIVFTIGGQQFSTTTNSLGNYELKINSIKVGEYKVIASAYKGGEIIGQKSSSTKTFSHNYITNMRSYIHRKTPSNAVSVSKTKKFTLENYIPQAPSFIMGNIFNIKIFVLNMFIAILSIILLFIAMIKRKVI